MIVVEDGPAIRVPRPEGSAVPPNIPGWILTRLTSALGNRIAVRYGRVFVPAHAGDRPASSSFSETSFAIHCIVSDERARRDMPHEVDPQIKDFRSFSGEHEFDVSAGVNYFIGPNNCGKSNLIRALELALDPDGSCPNVTRLPTFPPPPAAHTREESTDCWAGNAERVSRMLCVDLPACRGATWRCRSAYPSALAVLCKPG